MSPDLATQRSELEDERDFLLGSLDDLDAEHAAGDLEDDDHRALKDDYTARAAAVLRRLQRLDGETEGAEEPSDDDALDGDDAAPPSRRLPHSPSSKTSRRSRWPLILSIVVTLAVAGGAGYLVTRTSGERLPGQEMTAGPDQSPSTQLQQAIALDNTGKLVEAAKLYDAVLAKDPGNVIALTRRGWVLGRSGRQAGSAELLQAGLGYLDRATNADPSYADAHAFRGLVLGALARPGEAGCEFRLWLAIAPIAEPQRPAIEGVLAEATTQAGGTLPACPTPPAPVPAAVSGGPAAGPTPVPGAAAAPTTPAAAPRGTGPTPGP